MIGPTAQIAALTCHLNARKRGFAVPRFFPSNSTCQFCEFVMFVHRRRDWFRRGDSWKAISPTPDEWFDVTVGDDFSRAYLIHTSANHSKFPDRMLAGFVGGGGKWLLCVERTGDAGNWVADWEVGNRQAPDKRIWKVQYTPGVAWPITAPEATPINKLIDQLGRCLTDIESFARKQNTRYFADCFAKARRCLGSDAPFTLVYHRDLAPEGVLSLPATRLLAACQAAWVFGGMGSWNDISFEGTHEVTYQKLSNHLYGLLNQSICASVNQSMPT